MGTAGAKAFGEMLQINTTLTQLNVSGNSFGKMQVGDSVKLKSNGQICAVTQTYSYGDIKVQGRDGYVKPSEFEWDCSVPAFAAGIAASQSLLNVSAQHLCCCCLKRLTSECVPNVCFCQPYINTQVGVSGNQLGPEGGKAFADALQTNVVLQSIEIGSKDNPAIIPIKQLRDNSVDVLDYSGKKLLSEGGIVLAAALTVTQNTSVTTVSDIVRFCQLDLKMLI